MGADLSALAARAVAAAQVFVDDVEAPQLAPDDRHHLARVLRLADGEQVVAADGRGRYCFCAYRAGSLEPSAPPVAESAAVPALTIAFAPPKGDRPEWAVQKLTELGVDVIVPLAAERSVVRWDGVRAERALERLRRVARGAAAQCRRVWLPVIGPVATLAELAEGGGPGAGAGAAVSLAQLGGGPPSLRRPVVAIGPEGGWGPAELALGLPEVGLGASVLRAETAAVVAGAFLSGLRAGTVAGAGEGSSANPG